MSWRGKTPPKGYIPGVGRGATGFQTRSDLASGPIGEASGSRSAEARAAQRKQPDEDHHEPQYDDDDDEADRIWASIDQRMQGKRKRQDEDGADRVGRTRIAADFRDLKDQLATVTEDQWAAIPEVGDYSLKYKQQRRQDVFTPITDSLLEQRHQSNMDATAGSQEISAKTEAGDRTAVSSMSGMSAARNKTLGMNLDKLSSTGGSETTVDPQGYLTSLASSQLGSNAEIGDIKKARLLLKSVRDTNPRHGPGWIAAARVEEAAGKILPARKIIQDGCDACPDSEDVWLEAARLHPNDVAKSILATAVRRLPHAINIFLRAAELETHALTKKAVLRKALEANPTSVKLWKAAIDLEDAAHAKILLSVAVEKIPQSIDIWLALARLESYENAKKVLNKARKALPGERSIWLAAAKLEESQNHCDVVDKIVARAVSSLARHDAVATRAQWLEEAERSESAGAPVTSAAIVRHTIGMNVDEEDRLRTWAGDAKAVLARGSTATARSILRHALEVFPEKRSLWMQAVSLEQSDGDKGTLDVILEKASEALPKVEIFWLLRAKEQWLGGNVDSAREILTKAFEINPNSEAVWLAAAKLEWETGEIERARVLLQRARERAPTARVYMKSALLEREAKRIDEALRLIDEGIAKYPTFEKLHMMGGQICSEDIPKDVSSLARARKYFQQAIEKLPNCNTLWILACRLEESSGLFDPENVKPGVGATKARGLLEMARLKNPKSPDLWLESIRLERCTGNIKLVESLMAKALQECPTSGLLHSEQIMTAPRVEQKSKSAHAIKKCPDDPLVITAVASLFASERKLDKARKWFDRAVVLNPQMGDSWARYYAFELEHGTREQRQKLMERCVAVEPKYGELWTGVMKDMANRHMKIQDGLPMIAKQIIDAKNNA